MALAYWQLQSTARRGFTYADSNSNAKPNAHRNAKRDTGFTNSDPNALQPDHIYEPGRHHHPR
jgi:hypothetical protein